MLFMQPKLIKVLFILHFPPPVHGASMVGQYIKDSNYLEAIINARYVNLSTSDSLENIGSYGLKKIASILKVYLTSIKELLFFRPQVCYITLTATGVGFYKDSVIAMIAKVLGIKTVFHLHNKGIQQYQNKKFDNLLYRLVFHKSKLILLSPLLYQDVKKYIALKDCYFCPNGIPDYNVPKGSPKSHQSSSIKLLFISNLIRSKGILDVLEALARIKDWDFELNIVGAEADITKIELLEAISHHQLERKVRYLGKLYGEEKFKLLAKSDVFVFPTYYRFECLPISILEAMCFGLPVISTFEGAIPDLVKDKETGMLITSKNPKVLACAICEMIENPKHRKQMGMEGRKHFLNNFALPMFESKIGAILVEISN